MRTLVNKALEYATTIWLILVLLVVAGISSYVDIAKESAPDVPIPLIFVSVNYDGISPEDGVNLLLKPLENELKSITGLDEMQSKAFQNGASIRLKFDAGFDSSEALTDVREAVDAAKSKLPAEADEPVVKEINIATFPIVSVVLLGEAPERLMSKVAEDLQDLIEGLPTVLEAEISGKRENQILIEIDKNILESYRINPRDVIDSISNNNKLVTAGTLETSSSSYAIKVPGLFKQREDVLDLPIYSEGDKILKLGDVADVKFVFKDPDTITRFNGEPAMVLEVSKRVGENVIQTVDSIKELLENNKNLLPSSIRYEIINDESKMIRDMLSDLQNNVLASIILVMIIVLAVLGFRLSSLVAFSIPGSFLIAITMLYMGGFTVNMVVLFSLILSVGMLVDGAIVVVEMADSLMKKQNLRRKEAFRVAATTVVWPIATSTITTLIVFFPLLFWPGIVGEFMKFLPITLIFTLSASLAMATIFIPVMGSKIGKKLVVEPTGFEQFLQDRYDKIVHFAIRKPRFIMSSALGIFISTIFIYAIFNHGVEFFPDTEPENSQIMIRAKGDWSIYEKDEIVKKIEKIVLAQEGIKNVYSVSGASSKSTGSAQDIIGRLSIEYTDWDKGRLSSSEIIHNIKKQAENIYGIKLSSVEQQSGPKEEKPINIAIRGDDHQVIREVAKKLTSELSEIEGIEDLSNSLSDDGIEWILIIDREEASRSGTNLVEVGTTASLTTSGIKVGTYRPDESNDEYDIVARFEEKQRNLSNLDNLRVINMKGDVIPTENLMQREQNSKISIIERLDQKTVIYVTAGVAEGLLANDVIDLVDKKIKEEGLPQGVIVEFKGDRKDQEESAAFLKKSFSIAILAMLIILVTQFNNIYQALVILSAVVLSIAGVLICHLLLFMPFSIVMSGIGVIALAGIVVNNNIILIDAYNILRKEGLEWEQALIAACKSRLRPVLLTAITTLVGLMPMALKLTFVFTERDVIYDSSSSQMWTQLASSIAFGLTFATILTLIVTPSLIAWNEKRKSAKKERK